MSKQAFFYLIMNIFLLVFGQIFWKIGLQKVPNVDLNAIKDLMVSPYIWAGLLFYILATFFWFKVLSMLPLSMVYPMQSMAYVIGIFMAWLLLHESITLSRIIGSAVILIGVYIVSID